VHYTRVLEKLLKKVAEKFDPNRVDLKKYFMQLLDFQGRQINYNKLYVLTASRKDKKNINALIEKLSRALTVGCKPTKPHKIHIHHYQKVIDVAAV